MVEEHIIDEIMYDIEAALRFCGIEDTNTGNYSIGYYSEKYMFFYKCEKPVTRVERAKIYNKLMDMGMIVSKNYIEDIDLLRLASTMRIAACEEKDTVYIIHLPEGSIKEFEKDELLVIQ